MPGVTNVKGGEGETGMSSVTTVKGAGDDAAIAPLPAPTSSPRARMTPRAACARLACRQQRCSRGLPAHRQRRLAAADGPAAGRRAAGGGQDRGRNRGAGAGGSGPPPPPTTTTTTNSSPLHSIPPFCPASKGPVSACAPPAIHPFRAMPPHQSQSCTLPHTLGRRSWRCTSVCCCPQGPRRSPGPARRAWATPSWTACCDWCPRRPGWACPSCMPASAMRGCRR